MTTADWLKALVTIVTVGLGAWIASVLALKRWRAELTGKRRAELAEEVLVDLYRLRLELQRWNSKAILSEKARWDVGTLATHLAEMETRKFQFSAVFGVEAAKPYEEIEAAVYRMLGYAHNDSVLMRHQWGIVASSIEKMEIVCRAAISTGERRHKYPADKMC